MSSLTISDKELSGVNHVNDEFGKETGQWSEVLSIFNLTPSKIKGLKTLLEFGNLQNNWDTYGSPPPTKLAIKRALKLVTDFLMDDDPMPQIVPVSGGGIQFAWRKQDREVNLDILPDGRMEYVKSLGDNILEVNENFALDWGKVRSMLDWVQQEP